MLDNSIHWERLSQNSESKEISFELFNYQVAFVLYQQIGRFEYDYNTPGSEFYLTLTQDCPELEAFAGDVVGWQAKFWLSSSDSANTSLREEKRAELVDGFSTSLEYKTKIKTWVVCTPGQPMNSKPHCPKDALIKEIHGICSDTNVMFWNKPVYEALRSSNYEKLSPVFAHYFGERFVGRELCYRRTKKSLDALKGKFDVDCHVVGKKERDVITYLSIHEKLHSIRQSIQQLEFYINRVRAELGGERTFDDAEKQVLVDFGDLADELLKEEPNLSNLYDVRTLFERFRDVWNKNIKIFDDETKDFSLRASYFDDIEEVGRSLYDICRPVANVWGKAGSGKTCLAAGIAEYCCQNKIPAILLSGRQLSGRASVASQIIEKLDLPPDWTLRNVFACLNNLGFISRHRIPIIIDGLNETVPDCSIWKDEMKELTSSIIEFPYLVLISTSRPSYCNKLFEVIDAEEIPYGVKLSGFDEDESKAAVRKYFQKYDITVSKWTAGHRFFQHPLMLKLFCLANQGGEINEITHASVFAAIEEYRDRLYAAASSLAGEVDRLRLARVKKGVKALALYLWEKKGRSIELDELSAVLDDDHSFDDWRKTISCQLLDEGLFLERDAHADVEVVEFAYDLVAGLIIAQAVFCGGDVSNAQQLITDTDVLEKLNGTDSHGPHPLHEDIYKALVYLWPTVSEGELLIEKKQSPLCLQYTFEMLDTICAAPEQVRRLYGFLESHITNVEIISFFVSGVIESSVQHGKHEAAELFFKLLIGHPELFIENGLILSEAIRLKQEAVSSWLYHVRMQKEELEGCPGLLLLFALLLHTPIQRFRDEVVSMLIGIGSRDLASLQSTIELVVQLHDISVLEGFLCAFCGNVLMNDKPSEVDHYAFWLLGKIIPQISTTHVFVLDYCDTVFAYAEHLSGRDKFSLWRDQVSQPVWELDERVEQECTEQDAEWGFGPIGHDFARQTLNSLTPYGHETGLTKKTATSFMLKRISNLGYDIDQYQTLDQKVWEGYTGKEWQHKHFQGSYRSKIIRRAFFELWGQLLLDKKATCKNNGFRTPYCRVDPTQPVRPHRQQYLYDSMTARHDEPIEEWFKSPIPHPIVSENKRRYELGQQRWVLLDSYLKQTGKSNSEVTLWGHLYACKSMNVGLIIEKHENGRLDSYRPDYNHVFSGEIPWRHMPDEDRWCDEPAAERFVGYYNWCSYDDDHTVEREGSTPMLQIELAQKLGLKFCSKGMYYVDKEGVRATQLIWDNYSTFLFLREDMLLSLLEKGRDALVWCEHSFKYCKAEKDGEPKVPMSAHAYFAQVVELS